MTQTSLTEKLQTDSAGRLTYAHKVRLAQVCVVVGLIIAMELISRIGQIEHDFFPPPSEIFLNMLGVLEDSQIRVAIWYLLVQLVVSFALSIIIGVAVGYLVGAVVAVEKLTLPILLLIYSVPQITLLPLFVLYFGPGFGSKVAFGVSHGLFPIALSVVAGLNQARANPVYARWASSLGADFGKRILRVELPQAIGAILVGLRLSMSTTLLGVLLADIYISTAGVGYYTRLFAETAQGPKLFALITLVAVLAIAINSIVSRLEEYSSRWKRN